MNIPLLVIDNIEAFLFDMDGLLLDTERIYLECFVATCHAMDLPDRPEIYLACIGTHWQKSREILLGGYGPDFPYEPFIRRCRQAYDARLSAEPPPLKPGAKELLDLLKERNERLAVVTSTEHAMAVRYLSDARLVDYFEAVIGGDRVKASKPAPDIYLEACRFLGIQAERCLVFEDSSNGVRAACTAGMRVVQVPDLVPPDPDLESLGHRIMPSLLAVRDVLRAQDATGGVV